MEALGDAVRDRPGRRSAEERSQAVLELLGGKASVDQIARRFGVRPPTVEGWRDQALEGIGEAMRQGTGKSARQLELERDLAGLEKTFTHLAIKHELVERKCSPRPGYRCWRRSCSLVVNARGGFSDAEHAHSGPPRLVEAG